MRDICYNLKVIMVLTHAIIQTLNEKLVYSLCRFVLSVYCAKGMLRLLLL
jgi:hypothetical protein